LGVQCAAAVGVVLSVNDGQAAVSHHVPGLQPSIVTLIQAPAGEFLAEDVTGRSGVPLPLKIKPITLGDSNDIFAIDGLPTNVRLSSGGRYNDLWIVKRKHLETLALLTPDELQGVLQLAVTRAPTPTRPSVTRRFKVLIEPITATAAHQPLSKIAQGSTASIPKISLQYRRNASEQMLFDRASVQFKKGDVAGARAIYEFLATKGDAEAAFALGETYDAVALNQLFLEGVKADDDKAFAWYETAQRLGYPQAQARLNALDSMR
jgi:hypothetical protein